MQLVRCQESLWSWHLWAIAKRCEYELQSHLILLWEESIKAPRSPRAALIRTPRHKQQRKFLHWKAHRVPFPATDDMISDLEDKIASGSHLRFKHHYFSTTKRGEVEISDGEGSVLCLTKEHFSEALSAVKSLLQPKASANLGSTL